MQIEKQVTYTLELNGEFFLVENVPARVDEETGEQFFSPSTVERLQQIISIKLNISKSFCFGCKWSVGSAHPTFLPQF